MRGPGGLYNAGNLLGLAVGLAIAVAGARGAGTLAAAEDFVAGSPAAAALTVATAIFFWSGEHYYQAWKNGSPPDPVKNRLGDLSSGLGAVALGIGLAMLASPILAATSGFLHAAGKFGSGLDVERDIVLVGRRVPAMTLYRGSVLLSRVPAICVALASILGAVEVAPTGDAVRQSILPATMLVCYALWATADIQLMSEGGAIIRPVADSAAALWRRVLGYT